MSINVTIYNEFIHEIKDPVVKAIYPDGIHAVIADFISQQPDIGTVTTATLDEPEHGLTQEVCDNTDVMLWWGHMAHDKVDDAVIERVYDRVIAGMGLIVLHSGHFSKIFKKLMGTSCGLRWREAGEKERLWVVDPTHPIAAGIGQFIELPETEMYGEHFDIPEPDALVFISWFAGGDVFRSGATWRRGRGKVFYFRPGHETHPIYFDPNVQKVICNAVDWAAFKGNTAIPDITQGLNVPEPLEPLG